MFVHIGEPDPFLKRVRIRPIKLTGSRSGFIQYISVCPKRLKFRSLLLGQIRSRIQLRLKSLRIDRNRNPINSTCVHCTDVVHAFYLRCTLYQYIVVLYQCCLRMSAIAIKKILYLYHESQINYIQDRQCISSLLEN